MPYNSRNNRDNSTSGNKSLSTGKSNFKYKGIRTADTRDPGYKRTTLRGRKRVVRKRVQGTAVKGAQNQLKRFKQGSILAVALTGFLILLFTPEDAGFSQEQPQEQVTDTVPGEAAIVNKRADIPDSVAIIENVAVEDLVATEAQIEEEDSAINAANDGIGKAAKNEAVKTISNLWEGFYSNLPKILVAIVTLILAWFLVRFLKFLLPRIFKRKQSSGATITIIVICIWLFAIGLAISIVAGDIRALVGSLGLIGLALSWSLQTPIESFTGWLLNSFQGYYRVGDRISVGEVFGDVYKIDFLTTTVWEIGAPFRPGFVQAEQPTGRLVTFPNNEVLTGTVVNLTGDFPYVWDELAIAVANESDIREALKVMEAIATKLLGDYMKEPSKQYYSILQKANLDYIVSDKPQVYLSIGESWTDIIIRYLVGARERRKWKSELSLLIIEELNKEDYKGKIKPVYPRHQVQIIKPDGMAEEPERIGERKFSSSSDK